MGASWEKVRLDAGGGDICCRVWTGEVKAGGVAGGGGGGGGGREG